MTKSKKFKNVWFKAETIRAARAAYEKLNKCAKVKKSEKFSVYNKDDEYIKFDSQEEFFSFISGVFTYATYETNWFDCGYLSVVFRSDETEVTVSADSPAKVDAVLNIFSEAPPDVITIKVEIPKETSKTAGDSVSAVKESKKESCPTFRVNSRLPSCDLDVALLEGLEDYLLKESDRIRGTGNKMFERNYTVSLHSKDGVEVLESIRDYDLKHFPDNLYKVVVHMSDRYCEYPVDVSVSFNKDREFSELELMVRAPRARDEALALKAGVLRRVEIKKNYNCFYIANSSFHSIWVVLFFIVSFSFVATRVKYAGQDLKVDFVIYTAFFFAAVMPAYWLAGRVAKPYCSFDSVGQKRLNKWWDWFFFGVLSFIFFGTGLLLLRRGLFGF